MLPLELSHCRALKVLDLSNNPLKELPLFLGNLHSLKHLSASFCLLEKTGLGLYNLHRLEYLNLSYNFLTHFDTSFANLKKLRVLSIAGNDLIGIPPGLLLLTLHGLKEVELHNNPLTDLLSFDLENPLTDIVPTLKELAALSLADQVQKVTIGFTKSRESTEASIHHSTEKKEHQPAIYNRQLTFGSESSDSLNEQDFQHWHHNVLKFWWSQWSHAEKLFPRVGTCSWCGGPRYESRNPKLIAMRYCTEAYGMSNLPIEFLCCREECRNAVIHCTGEEFAARFYTIDSPVASWVSRSRVLTAASFESALTVLDLLTKASRKVTLVSTNNEYDENV
ncbi:Leucine-rich repeat-containing protein 63 [Cichlidogyrus casuarinus]|uniref:Leucine-rich repeat-containing protein 63 n=1 Tax=Cichlidogyrus casuarinus TaxID=1844966 RepID=A0ABD2Q142_9PLAT